MSGSVIRTVTTTRSLQMIEMFIVLVMLQSSRQTNKHVCDSAYDHYDHLRMKYARCKLNISEIDNDHSKVRS